MSDLFFSTLLESFWRERRRVSLSMRTPGLVVSDAPPTRSEVPPSEMSPGQVQGMGLFARLKIDVHLSFHRVFYRLRRLNKDRERK